MKKLKIMVVDDDKLFLEELKETLEMSGFEIFPVSDSKTAVKVADESKPDAVLLDMKMDGRSGFQVADDLRHFPSTSMIPIVAMTGCFTEKQHINFMKNLGINDCILKPFTPSDVIDKIQQLIGEAVRKVV